MTLTIQLLALMTLATSSAAAAQATGSSESGLLSIQSRPPALTKCSRWNAQTCFKVMLEVSSDRDEPTLISYDPNGELMEESHAYLDSGVMCKAIMISGVPIKHSNRPWTSVRKMQPARAIVEFGCTGPVRPGEVVFMDLSFWIAPDGKSSSFERYSFPETTIR